MAAFAARGLAVIGWDLEGDAGSDIVRVDLLNDAETRVAADSVRSLRGQLRQVIAAAGGGNLDELRASSIADETPSVLHRVVEANMMTAFSVNHHMAAILKASSGNRSITLLSSNNALGGFGAPGYSAANLALPSLTKALAPQLGPNGIRINVVLPGAVHTQQFIRLARGQGKSPDFESLAQHVLLLRVLDPSDVAVAIAAIALDLTGLTGAQLVLDGGRGRSSRASLDPSRFCTDSRGGEVACILRGREKVG